MKPVSRCYDTSFCLLKSDHTWIQQLSDLIQVYVQVLKSKLSLAHIEELQTLTRANPTFINLIERSLFVLNCSLDGFGLASRL